MSFRRIGSAALIPVGFQVMSLADTTAVAVDSTCRDGSVLHISVETTDARYRADGTSPTNTTGVCLQADTNPIWVEGFDGTSVFEIVRSGGSGTSKVSLMSYKYPGE